MTRLVIQMLFVGCVVLALNVQAHGALVVDITGIPGSGQTTWTFSGSAVAGSGGGFFDENGDLGNADTWTNIGNYTTVDDFDLPASTIISGSATISINSVTRNITFGYIDHDAGGDDFGVGVDGATNFIWTAGNTVSWTGSIVTNIDLNDLDESGLPASFSTSNYGGGSGTLDLVVNISNSAGAVPEPGTLLSLLVGLGAIGLPYRRARKNRKQMAQRK